jgi:hypothetical protein
MSGSGLTVPGGDPAALRQLAVQLRTAAQGSGNLGSNTSRITDAIISDAQWTGAASDSFGAFSANLGRGASAAEAPLTRIADAVENYAGFLDVAQQKTHAANAIFQAAENDPTGSLLSTAEQARQNAMDALGALRQAGDQAAAQVASATDDLQVRSLLGSQGPVTTWAGGQPSLGTHGLRQRGEPVSAQTGIFQIDDGIGLGSLVDYHADDLPRLDGTGKIHTGPEGLPRFVPSHWTREKLQEYREDLKRSIQTRQQEQIDKGEERGHRARINEELRLLRQVDRKLSGS